MPETPSLATRVGDLLANIPRLPESRRSFAQSMCDQFARRGTLSEAQALWVDRLNEIARGTQQVPVVAQVGDLAGIMQLFARAAPRLRHPAIVLSVPAAGNLTIRLSIATERARVPGSINVVAPEQRDTYGRPVWYGRIMQDGNFVGTTRPTPTAVSIVTDRLREFAADPARIAGEHGRLTGRCCFCNLRLTDERSTATGYGPVCAGHYQLPWGMEASNAMEAASNSERRIRDGGGESVSGIGSIPVDGLPYGEDSWRNYSATHPSGRDLVETSPASASGASQGRRPEQRPSLQSGMGNTGAEYAGHDSARSLDPRDAEPPREAHGSPSYSDQASTLSGGERAGASGRVRNQPRSRLRHLQRSQLGLALSPPASATRIDEMPLGPRGDLE